MRIAARVLLVLVLSAITVPAISQEVTLPLEDYQELRRRANPEPPPEAEPPAPFSLESVDIEIEIGDDSARLNHQLTLSIYDDGWHTVPLSESGSPTSMSLGNLEGRLSGDASPELVVRGVGRHTIELVSVVPLVDDPVAARPTRTLELELPRAGVVTGYVRENDAVEEIVIASGGLPRTSANAARFEFVGSPGSRLVLELLGEDVAPDRTVLPLRFEARSVTLVSLSRTRLAARTTVTADVAQGRLEALRLSVPEWLDVVRVDAGESGWNRDGETLTVTLAEPSENAFSVTILMSGEHTSTFAAPLVVPVEAERTVLVTGLQVEADGIPIVEDVGASRRARDEDLGALWTPLSRAFVVRDASRPPRWSVEWSDAAQTEVLAAQVDRLTIDALVGDDGRAAYQLWATVRSAGSLTVSFDFPPGFELASAERDGDDVTPGAHPDGRVEIPLIAGADAQMIHVVGVLPFVTGGVDGDDEVEVPVPSLSIPVARVEVRAAFRADRIYEIAAAHIDRSIATPPEPFIVPEGFRIVEAGWTALSPAPKPLVLYAKREKHKRKWY